MKKIKTALLVMAASAALGLPHASMADSIRFASHLPPTHPLVDNGADVFLQGVKDKADIDYRVISGGALFGPREMLSGLADGGADMGNLVFTYFPAELPVMKFVADMSMVGSNPYAVAAATTEFAMAGCEICITEFENNNLVNLGNTSSTPFILISKERITDPEQLKGLKLRVPGALWDSWARAMGTVPVNIPSSEMYEAISRGQLDAILQPAGALKTYSVWDSARDITQIKVGTFRTLGVLMANSNSWKRQSEKVRQAMLDSAAPAVILAVRDYAQTDAAAIEEGVANKGVEVHQPSADLQAVHDKFIAESLENAIKSAEEAGKVPDPSGLAKTYGDLIAKWEGLFEGLGNDDHEKMIELVNQEIFSKINVKTYGM